jgi:hypothetical protein
MVIDPLAAYANQPYIQAITRAVAEGRLAVAPGTVATLTVLHDDGCPALTGGYCCCNPDLAIVPLPKEPR